MAEYSDNIEQLYRALEKKGYNDIGTQDEFRQYVTDSANVSELHKALSKAGYDDIGTEQEFSDWLGSVKKSEVKPAEVPADSVPDTMPDTTGSVVNAPAVAPETIAGSQEWRTNTVNQPGQNPYNGRTYGDIYDEVIRNYGQNIAKQGIDPYAEARAQIIQAGITDDLKPEDADKLALNIRHGYANRYADNVSKEMISTLPDQVPNIDDLVDGLWYTRDMQARVNHEAARLGLRKENYVNYYLKPHIAKALSDRYGYDTESAKHIAGRLLSQEEHTTDAIRRNEAAGVISEFASPMINEQFKKIQEVADKVSQQEREGSGMTPYGNYGQMMGGAIRNWQATDPEKVWQQLKPVFDDMGSWMGIVGNEQLFDQISQMAEAEGIPVNAYIDQYVIPAYANTVQKEFERIAVEREMPKNTFDYIVQKMGESLVGSIGKWMLASEARRRAQSEALQQTDMGQGEYKPGYGARIAGGAAAMLPDMILPYGGPFGIAARVGNKPINGMAQYLITNGWKPLFARMAQSSAGGMTSLGAFEGVKGAIQGTINPEGYESILAEDKRNAFEILSDMIKGGFEHAVPSAVMGATMVGGPLGQKISNGRGLLANMLGWGTQVGVDAAGATALSAIQNMPKIVKGDITVGDLGNEFLESVGTFAALGLHGKAKEFASLAEGGRSINGVSFSKSEVQTIEDIFGKPMRDVIDDIDKLQKSRSLITKSRLGITAETENQERNDAIKDAATYLFGNIMKSYQVPADMKVRMCQAFNVPLPEYALKPKVLETFDEAIAKSVDAGWIDMMNYEFNRPGGVADKLENDGPKSLSDYELTLRLLFQDNKRYNEIGAKLQAGEELTPDEIGLVNSYNKRLEAIQADYFKMEKERITAEFENAKGLKRGTIQKMIDDLKQGKGVSDPAMLNEFEEAMRVLSETLDEYKQKKEAAPTEENQATVAEAPKVNKAPVAEAPVTAETPVTDEVPTGDIPAVEIPEETVTVDPKLLVNDETGNIVEVMLTDGRKAYVKSGDPAKDARLKLVDEQGNPITLDDGNGYTIDQVPVDMIARDDSGNMLISQTEQPKVDTVDTTTDEVPAVPKVKVDKDGEPIYEESDIEATINDLRTSMGSDEEVAELVNDQISDLTEELAELTKAPKGKAKKHTSMNEKKKKKEAIKAAQKKLDYWNSVKEALNKPADVEQSTAEVEQPAAPQEPEQPKAKSAQQQIYEATINKNVGKKFEYTDNAGMRTEITIDGVDDNGKVIITRQDFDKQGNPVTKPTKQTFEASRIGKGIIEGAWKPAKTIGDRLREAFKDKKKLQALTDVLNEDEMQKVMEAYEKGDQEALNDIVYELEEKHREDLIMKDRDERNASVERILNGAGSREEKLRRIRLQYQGNRDAEEALSDESMQPTSFEEIIADMHSRVPKKGEGPIAYYSYTTPDGHEVAGMQSETGHGKKSGGDTKGYAPWLAPQGKGMSLTQYAENLRSQMSEAMQEQHDVQDVRNYVRDMFTSAEKPSDIPLMILRRAVQNAEIAVRHEEDMAIDNPSYQKVSHDEKSFAGRLAKAKQTTNTEPTEAQKEKGNYKKGHVSFGGYDYVIENPEGSMRRGEADGKKWEQKMNNTYGYILGKYGKDGDHLDMFINDGQDLDNWNGKVYVVDQIDPKTGLFDEHKVMYGFNSEAEARDAYLSNYEKGWKGLGAITGVSKEAFDKWLDSSKRKLIRFADHSIVRDALDKQANEPATDAEIETATRDLLIDGIKKAGADISTNYEEGQAGIDDFYGTGEIKPMGTSTKKRQKLIAEVFNDSKLSEDERKLVDVFSGKNDKTTLTITDKAGKNRKIQFRQGNERKAGIRHSVFRHLLTDANSYTADEVTLIPDIIANGERTQDKGNKASYKYKKDGVVYTVTTEVKGKNELFTNFYTDRKPTATEQGTLNTENQHVQPQQTVSDAKIQQNSETAKKNEEKISLQKGGFQLTIEQQERMDQARKMQPNPMKRYAVINMDNPYSVPKYFEKKEYANSYKVWGNRMGGNFKAFDLDANEKEGRPMFFKTPDGYAYGFTYRGKIYIDPSIATSETPIHEYGHLWAEMKRRSAPEEWNHIKQTLLADKLVEPFIEKVKRDYPELTGEGKEDDFVEEVLTQFSGKHGAEKLRKMAQEIKKELGDDATAETIAEAAIRRVKSVLNEFWKSVCGMMGWKYTNAEEIADAVLRDLLNGVNPVEEARKAVEEGWDRDAHKQSQFDIISKANPFDENLANHTWIKSVDDVKTFDEALKEGYEPGENVTPDYTSDMVEKARRTGKVKVYSSHPIKNGTFVSPSKMEAKNYAGDGKVYSKEVSVEDVAWIDAFEGQYAKIDKKKKAIAKRDQEYADAVKAGDMEKVDAMLREEARKNGYTEDSDYQGTSAFNGTAPSSNKYYATREERAKAFEDGDFTGHASLGDYMEAGIDLGNLDWTLHDWRGFHTASTAGKESIMNLRRAVDGNKKTITMYRSVPSSVKENSFRNGDWITPSRLYAEENALIHGWGRKYRIIEQEVPVDDIWWDNNDINEWGYDDGKGYAYKNTKNNRKLLEPTYDEEGKLIPLSKRFDQKQDNIMYQLMGKKGAEEADRKDESTIRTDNNRIAEEMEKVGKDANTIKLATGWERGKDGKWRYEIPDATEVNILEIYNESKKDGTPVTLMDILGADNEIFKFYPELKDMPVKFDEQLAANVGGSYNKKDGIRLNAKDFGVFDNADLANEGVYGTLLHEIQHAIQDIEGFAQGGNLQSVVSDEGIKFVTDKIEAKRSRILQDLDADRHFLSDPEELELAAMLDNRTVEDEKKHLQESADKLQKEYDRLGRMIQTVKETKEVSEEDARDFYQHIAGEVESRNVTRRMDMSEEQRLSSLAADTEDVNRNEQVVMMDYPERESMSMDKDEIEKIKPFHDVIDEMFSNPDFNKSVHNRDRYYLGKTPDYMKKIGITGDDFYLSFKNIKTHQGKDQDHNLGPKEWHEIPSALKNPFLITKYGKDPGKFRLYTRVKVGDKYAVVGVDVIKTNQGKNKPMLEINRIKTVFGRDRYVLDNGEDIVAYNEEITPEQEALLRGHNFREYPSIQELSGGKDKKNIDSLQEKSEKSADEMPRFSKVSSPEPELTPEERQYWNKWNEAMKKWKEQNALPADAEAPGPETPKRPDETIGLRSPHNQGAQAESLMADSTQAGGLPAHA